ncbi:MAG: ABC transporter ATP-binding protein [Gammaproteobacteria bacterium]
MSVLAIRNVWKQYGAQVVLERINLTVPAREFCTIVGASGCGKTTFLRMLLGQETPSRGAFELDGQPLRGEPGPERGVVFQRYSVFPHLTVRDNVLLGLELGASRLSGRLFGAARRQALARVDAALQAVGLEGAAAKYPSALSGGMQQRLAIAQALIKQPKILLLDEPFGALDPGIRADMHKLLLGLWRATGMTVFMITHDLREAFALGTRLLVFDKVRRDPQAPERFGATITFDIPLARRNAADDDALRALQARADYYTGAAPAAFPSAQTGAALELP